ncbi:MAG: LysM peptidoglycan-binding domain-containing protein [Gammaproteobacteria bacterium]|nr:LysM peptidoglycan-binding domain-containing protein [Gammaproteobacteria bacterium]
MAFVPWEVGVAGPEAARRRRRDPAHSEAQCRAGYGALAFPFQRPRQGSAQGKRLDWPAMRLSGLCGLLLVVGCATTPVTPPLEKATEVVNPGVEPSEPAATIIESTPPPAVETTPPATVEAPLPSSLETAAPPTDEPDVVQVEPTEPAFLDRLGSSFRLDHSLDRKNVRREIEWLARHPERLARRDRLLEYLPYVCDKVWDRGIPGEICLLPIVESRLDPFAFSPGGAVGLWQFIPATAKRFGLKIDWWVDERRDVVLATDAALDYLEELHDRFGDWLLALAAYNWGEGRVSRELRRTGSNASFFDLKVPRETSRYVDRLLAYSAVFADPARFGIQLPLSDSSVSFAVVDTGGQVDLARAAEAIGCDLDEIYRRNPALNRWATHPEGPHQLVVSAAVEARAAQALAEIPDSERLAWVRHAVSQGDTLSEIARTYRTTVETLKQANRLSGTLIRIGDHLLVPNAHSPPRYYEAYSGRSTGSAGVYVVKRGDSIWRIARRLGLRRQALMQANQIGPNDILRVGQQLSIPN